MSAAAPEAIGLYLSTPDSQMVMKLEKITKVEQTQRFVMTA